MTSVESALLVLGVLMAVCSGVVYHRTRSTILVTCVVVAYFLIAFKLDLIV